MYVLGAYPTSLPMCPQSSSQPLDSRAEPGLRWMEVVLHAVPNLEDLLLSDAVEATV